MDRGKRGISQGSVTEVGQSVTKGDESLSYLGGHSCRDPDNFLPASFKGYLFPYPVIFRWRFTSVFIHSMGDSNGSDVISYTPLPCVPEGLVSDELTGRHGIDFRQGFPPA